jgi:hypothetical protein
MDEKKKRARKIGRLTTVMQVAAELGRVYRDVRHEKIDSAYGNRMANILTAMRGCMEASEFERRIAEIETAVSRSMSRFTPMPDPTRSDATDVASEASEATEIAVPTGGSERHH